MKKTLSVLLSLIMVAATLFALPFSANAAEIVGGPTNFKIADDLSATWDGTDATVDGVPVAYYYIGIAAFKTSEITKDCKTAYTAKTTLAEGKLDYKTNVSYLLDHYPEYTYLRYFIKYYDKNNNAISDEIYSDAFDLSGFTLLNKPVNVETSGNVISWCPVTGATEYTVSIFGISGYHKNIVTTSTSCDISSAISEADALGEMMVIVDLYAGNINTGYSKSATVIPSDSTYVGDYNIDKLYVGNVLVNDTNASDIFGDGTASFDKITKTLTLNNANITTTTLKQLYGENCKYCILSSMPITIKLIGENKITVSESGSDVYNCAIEVGSVIPEEIGVHFIGNGSLDLKVNKAGYCCSVSTNSIVVDNATINIDDATTGEGNGAIYSASSIELNNATLKIQYNSSYSTAIYTDDLEINNSSVKIISPNKGEAINTNVLRLNSGIIDIASKDDSKSKIKATGFDTTNAIKIKDTSASLIYTTVKDKTQLYGLTENVDYKATVTPEKIIFNGIGKYSFEKSFDYSCAHTDFRNSTVTADCYEDGGILHECKNCTYFYFEKTNDALGHNYTTVSQAVPANCTTAGKTAVKECSRCGDRIGGTVVSATGHTSDKGTVTKKATCTAAGTKTFKCTVCGKVFKTEPVKATGHTEVVLKAVTATAKKSGLTAGKKCSVCGKVLVAQKMTLAQVTGLKASTVKKDSIKLTWTKIAGAKYYKVEQSTDGKTWKVIKTVDTNSYTVSKLTAGKKYQFRVTALDSTKKISGKASATLKTGTLTAAPSVTVKSSKSKTAVASWKKVTGASKYIVYKSTDGKKWDKGTTTTKTSLTLSKLTGGKKIYVKAVAVNAYGKNSAASAVKNVTVKK